MLNIASLHSSLVPPVNYNRSEKDRRTAPTVKWGKADTCADQEVVDDGRGPAPDGYHLAALDIANLDVITHACRLLFF
jgi:hypothetical protein